MVPRRHFGRLNVKSDVNVTTQIIINTIPKTAPCSIFPFFLGVRAIQV
jgi:hypothetical protein